MVDLLDVGENTCFEHFDFSAHMLTKRCCLVAVKCSSF